MGCNPPGYCVHGILQTRILEWVAMPFSRGSSRPRDLIPVSYVSCIGRWILYHWATREVPLQLELYANIEIKHLFSYLFGPFPGGANGKEPTCQYRDVRDTVSIPVLGRSPGVGNGNPLQYSCLENPMDTGAWRPIVLELAKSQTWLSTPPWFKWFGLFLNTVMNYLYSQDIPVDQKLKRTRNLL